MSENLLKFKAWIKQVDKQINLIKHNTNKNKNLIYMIGSTSSRKIYESPYITPLRKISNAIVIGSIVFTQTQARILASKIDGKVDYIFLDAEKKLPTIKKPDHRPYKILKKSHLIPVANSEIEYGNISAACSKIIKKSKIQEYKANDITVDATWNFLVNKVEDLSGKKILIFGSGNIGLKLALKLVECGAEISVIARKVNKTTKAIISSLNKIKNKGVLSEISIKEINNLSDIDIIIGCTNSNPVISEKILKQMNTNGIVIDLGKGTISEKGVIYCNKKNIETWRVDIGPMLDSIVSASLSMKNLINYTYGKTQLSNGVSLVSGGFLGNKYDVVVDNHKNPKSVVGICSGPGIFMKTHNKKSKNILKYVNRYIFKNNPSK